MQHETKHDYNGRADASYECRDFPQAECYGAENYQDALLWLKLDPPPSPSLDTRAHIVEFYFDEHGTAVNRIVWPVDRFGETAWP